MRSCSWCAGELPRRARADARFCSGRCRVASHRAGDTAIPAELVTKPRWVRRSPTKVPLTVAGGAASSTNSATWSSWSKASASHIGAGLGFVLNGDGIVCLDLDHCLAAGEPSEAAQRLLSRLPGTYVEVSPSGDGLHVWGRASVVAGRKLKRDGLQVEVYGRGRYIAMTGRPFRGSASSLADLSEVVEHLLN